MNSIMTALGWLPYCFCGYAACLVGWTIWKRERPKHAEKWMRFLSHVRKEKNRGRGLASWWPVTFSAICVGILILSGSRINSAPIVEKYNVQVLRQIGFNQWSMIDDQGPFLYTACDDFPNDKVIWAGYIARKVRWQEFGSCKSIRRQDLGFWWLRDKDYNVKEIGQ